MKRRLLNQCNILSHPTIYSCFQKLLGADACRRRLVQDFVKPSAGVRILDFGCGTADIIDCLPDNVEYVGTDHSASYIAFAQKKFGNKGKFHCSSVDEKHDLGDQGSFDIVLAMGVLHHLNDEQARLLIRQSRWYLKEGGTLITFDCVYVHAQSLLARFIISKDRGEFIRDPSGYLSLLGESFKSIEYDVLHDAIRIPYTHFLARCVK